MGSLYEKEADEYNGEIRAVTAVIAALAAWGISKCFYHFVREISKWFGSTDPEPKLQEKTMMTASSSSSSSDTSYESIGPYQFLEGKKPCDPVETKWTKSKKWLESSEPEPKGQDKTMMMTSSSSRLVPDQDRIFSNITGYSDTGYEALRPCYVLEGRIKPRDPVQTKWTKPQKGWVKLNVDISEIRETGKAVAGGVIRDDTGEWKVGFTEKLGVCDTISAEIQVITKGLYFALNEGYRNVETETDSEQAFNYLKRDDLDHKYWEEVQDCKQVKNRSCWKVELSHIYRERNRCANAMAKNNRDQIAQFKIWHKPPDYVLDLLSADKTLMMTMSSSRLVLDQDHLFSNVTRYSDTSYKTKYPDEVLEEIKWTKPKRQWLKLNIAASQVLKNGDTSGPSVGAGVIRDHTGKWIVGFTVRLGDCDTTSAHLLAIRKGMHFALERNYRKVEIETASQAALDHIKSLDDLKIDPCLWKFVQDCRRMMKLNRDVKMEHVNWEFNECAYQMARRNRGQIKPFMTWDEPPDHYVHALVLTDMV